MKKIYTLLFALYSLFGHAQSVKFQVSIGGNANDRANCIQQTSDNGYIVCGNTFSFGSGTSADAYLVKLSETGVLQWSKTYGGAGLDNAHYVQQTSDGGYIMVGTSGSFSFSQDMYIIKTDSIGDTLWTRTFGDAGEDNANRVIETDAGNYLVTGSLLLASQTKLAVLLISANGTLLSQKYLIDPLFASPRYAGTMFPDNHIAMFGHSNLFSLTDSVGNFIQNSNYSYGGPTIDAIYTHDQHYTFLVNSDIGGPQGGKLILAKLDPSTGLIDWEKKYSTSGDNLIGNVIETADHNFMMLSTTINQGSGIGKIILVKADSVGILQWTKLFSTGGNNDHVAANIINTNDGGYAISGSTTINLSFNNYNFYIIKTDSAGESSCNQTTTTITSALATNSAPSSVNQYSGNMSNTGTAATAAISIGGIVNTICTTVEVEEKNDNSPLTFFPNPVHDFSSIVASTFTQSQFYLYDITGRILMKQNFNEQARINFSSLTTGLYMAEVKNENGTSKKVKLIKD